MIQIYIIILIIYKILYSQIKPLARLIGKKRGTESISGWGPPRIWIGILVFFYQFLRDRNTIFVPRLSFYYYYYYYYYYY